MSLHGGWISILSLQARKVVLPHRAAGNSTGMEDPRLCSFQVFQSQEPGTLQGGTRAARVLVDLVLLGRTQCHGVVGDIRLRGCDLETFFTYKTSKLGTPCSQLVFSSEPLLLQTQSWSSPKVLQKLLLPELGMAAILLSYCRPFRFWENP